MHLHFPLHAIYYTSTTTTVNPLNTQDNYENHANKEIAADCVVLTEVWEAFQFGS